MECKELELIQDNGRQNMPQADDQWSGNLTNPCKRFFLQLATHSLEDVKKQIVSSNISYARKVMIRCGLTCGIHGTWDVNQLFPNLQEIIHKHEVYFQGADVPLYARGT